VRCRMRWKGSTRSERGARKKNFACSEVRDVCTVTAFGTRKIAWKLNSWRRSYNKPTIKWHSGILEPVLVTAREPYTRETFERREYIVNHCKRPLIINVTFRKDEASTLCHLMKSSLCALCSTMSLMLKFGLCWCLY
jgi:hypothetical protein